MTPKISLVAVCLLPNRIRLSSLNNRTFSMAMTAWSAKVSSSAICFSENGLNLNSSNVDQRRSPLLRAAAVS